MAETFLIPEQTAEAKGEGLAVPLDESPARRFLVSLEISRIIEQESLAVSVWGSEDGSNWGAAPLAAFPQKFYAGAHQLLIDLSDRPEIKFLRAKWEVNRWGRGELKPLFTFSVALHPLAE
jgi:hypothetical protein